MDSLPTELPGKPYFAGGLANAPGTQDSSADAMRPAEISAIFWFSKQSWLLEAR